MHFAPTPSDDFEPWEIRQVEVVVKKFLGAHPWLKEMEADLCQEAVLHWYLKRDAYRADGGAAPKTFLDRVVHRRLISIVREWAAAKRGGKGQPLSLDRPATPNGEVALGELLPDLSDAPAPEMVLDLNKALRRLTRRQYEVAAGLAAGNQVMDIATRLGISRDTVNEDRKAIRRIFEDEGLAEYFR